LDLLLVVDGAAVCLGPQVLQALGIQAAFDKADFSKASASPLVLSNVLHSAVVQVDESGTEAAAATAAITLKSAMGATPPKSLVSTLQL
jgi:serpin B